MLGTRILESPAQMIPSLLPETAWGFYPSPSTFRPHQLFWEGIKELQFLGLISGQEAAIWGGYKRVSIFRPDQ